MKEEQDVSDLIVEVALYIEVEVWDKVFKLLLDMNQLSYERGQRAGIEVAKLLK